MSPFGEDSIAVKSTGGAEGSAEAGAADGAGTADAAGAVLRAGRAIKAAAITNNKITISTT